MALVIATPQKVNNSQIQKNIKQINSENDLNCMTDVIFYEANSESYEGKLAVGTVVMNRVRHRGFPNSVCGVVKQKGKRGCQFSWVCGPRAKMDKTLYQRAKKVALDVLMHHKRLTSIGNALYFHTEGISPSWINDLIPIQQIGPHIFYVKRT